MYKLRALPVFVVVALFLFSCKGGKQENVSPTTGWGYRDPRSSDVNDLGYPIGEASEQVTGPNLVLIEGGTFTMGRVEPIDRLRSPFFVIYTVLNCHA